MPKKQAKMSREVGTSKIGTNWFFYMYMVASDEETPLIRFAYHSPPAYSSKASAERGMTRWIATMREAFS